MRSESALHKRIAFRDRMTPHFGGGGRSRPTPHAAPGTQEGVFKLASHRGMSQIDEYGCGRPERKVLEHPPL